VLVLIVLSEAAQRGVQSVELEYRVSNLPAESLYRKLGFRSVGRRPGYYRDTGEDAILAATDALQSSRGQEALRRQRERWEQERDFELVLEL
jgi:ribosomal protein S18 acetylase RimI-like enzyme